MTGEAELLDDRAATVVRRWRARSLQLAGGAGVVLASAEVAASGLPSAERRVYELLAGLPTAVATVLWLPMQAGTFFAPVVVAAVAWVVLDRWRPALGALAAGLGAWLGARLVKDTVERARPGQLVAEVAPKLDAPLDGWGYPSGHAAVAFALVGVLSPWMPSRWRRWLWALAVAVAFARVTIGAHLPLDVVGGAAIGLACAVLWHLAAGEPARD